MHPRIIAMLERLDENEWFTQVGMKGDIVEARVISSWAEAIKLCSSPDWENICIEAANQLREAIVKASPERFALWNSIVMDVKRIVEPMVSRKIASVVRENNLPPSFENTVRWDMLHICREAEYADITPPGFYSRQCRWYIEGHFPCGWEGMFPAGKLVIY